jgi:V8-like Glu-specific endopeptidase
MYKLKNFKVYNKLLFYIILLYTTNVVAITAIDHIKDDNYISPYIIPCSENNQFTQEYSKQYENYYWGQYYSPTGVWWVPYEFNSAISDVVEAVVSPFIMQNNLSYYTIKVGTARENITQEQINIVKAVGRLTYRPKVGIHWTCTATHVGNNYVVTAGHCLPDPRTNPTVCDDLNIEWGYRRYRDDYNAIPTPDLIGKCTKIISWEFKSGDANTIDHAIIQVDNAPQEKVDILAKPQLKVGTSLYQLSHPGGHPLIWSKKCEVTRIPYQFIQHNCWGASGSSGSALIDVDSKSLVGVLSMGRDATFFTTRNDVSPIGCFNVDTGDVMTDCHKS